MLYDAKSRLREWVATGEAVVLVGAGVSMQVSGSTRASWQGFMRTGLEVAVARGSGDDEKWADDVRRIVDTYDLARRLEAEDQVLRALGGLESSGVATWLEQAIGTLKVADSSPVDALAALGCPILTLNYDTLIEDRTGWESVTWQEPRRMQEVAKGEVSGVIHLHGHWRDPASVIIGSDSYASIAAERNAQRLVEAVSYVKSLVLVGFGAPLSGVHFAPLRGWLQDSPRRHVRLVRSQDAAQFEEDAEDTKSLELAEYGEDFTDLAPFLESLKPPPGSDREGRDGHWLARASPVAVFFGALSILAALDKTGVETVVFSLAASGMTWFSSLLVLSDATKRWHVAGLIATSLVSLALLLALLLA